MNYFIDPRYPEQKLKLNDDQKLKLKKHFTTIDNDDDDDEKDNSHERNENTKSEKYILFKNAQNTAKSNNMHRLFTKRDAAEIGNYFSAIYCSHNYKKMI